MIKGIVFDNKNIHGSMLWQDETPIYTRVGSAERRDLLPEGRRDAAGVGSQAGQQTDLFAYSSKSNKSGRLMDVLDRINGKYRRGTIHLASQELAEPGPCGAASRALTTPETGTSCLS